MKLKEFNFKLPESLIALRPKIERSQSKLLVLEETISDYRFTDLISLIRSEDVLVINDSAVIKARLYGKKHTGAIVEILVERILEQDVVSAQTRSNAKLKKGDKISLSKHGPTLTITTRGPVTSNLKFSKPVRQVLENYGRVPLPPYIKREATHFDLERYQTVYANPYKANSVAAPTAGLHFDNSLIESIKAKGAKIAKVTLDIGLGTFKPIKSDSVSDHKMHKERIHINEESVEVINETRRKKGRVICVGTTSVRCIESVCNKNKGNLKPFSGETDLFIFPGYEFRATDIMITNFHLPSSSLLVLVSAFAGHARIMAAYKHAIKKRYRFYSYGDAMFIYPKRN